MVDLSEAAPGFVIEQTSNQTAFPVVVFLFRLEEVNSHNVSFVWMVRSWCYTAHLLSCLIVHAIFNFKSVINHFHSSSLHMRLYIYW